MAELLNPQEEKFCRMLATGMDQATAYSKCGWVKDKANASKKAKLPHIVERVAELRAEEASRLAKLRMEAGDLPGADELKRALAGAAASGNWSAAVTASKALADLDGSGEALNASRPLTDAELLAEAKRAGPVQGLAMRMCMTFDSFDRPPVPAEDIEIAIVGLAHWFDEGQLKELGARLLARR